ncbi:MFS general substrate transporter [Mycena olivaceomarginata]|nr:MFS general substrate transporter [Mycena olivaceomarginata]
MNDTVLDPKEVARIERKIDWLIIPALSICYMVDKTTLSYAAIFNVKKDLNLGKSEYAIGWIVWAIPTNLLMQKFPLNKYLAANIFVWGALLMAQAGSRNFTDLAILRTISGAAEATADPAFVLITSTWYTREQQPIRIGYWYCANGVGIGLGGLLGFAIGLPSWKYEFLIIGALCCTWAIFMLIFIPDSPYQTHWFNRAERLIIVSRKRKDQNSTDNRHWDSSQVIEAFMDIKTYLFFCSGSPQTSPTYAFIFSSHRGGTSNLCAAPLFSFFNRPKLTPTPRSGTLIVQGFGFNTFNTTLMQLPYGAIIVGFIVGALIVNSKVPKGNRTYLMVATTIPTVVGFAMVAWAKPKAARLIGLTGASNATFVVVGGQTKKAMASAAVFLGVAAGSVRFKSSDSEAPKYLTGVVGCMVSRILEIFVILALRLVFSRANAKRDRDVAEGRVQYDERITALQDISDWKNPAFRYVLVNYPCLKLRLN